MRTEKILFVVTLFVSCSLESQEDLAGVAETPPDPKPETNPKVENERGPVEIAESMYELGRKIERIHQELDPMAKTVVFMVCLEGLCLKTPSCLASD